MKNKIQPWPLQKSESGPDIPLFDVEFNYHTNPRTGDTLKRLRLVAPDWVNVVPLTPEGKLVVVQQYRFGTQQLTTEIPAGIIDPGEDSGTAAARELREETGFTTGKWEYLGKVGANPAIQNNFCHHWLARDVQLTEEIDLGEGEDIIVKIISIDELHEEIAAGRFSHSLAFSALSRMMDLWKVS
jgi:8-oxo-dGTP pyrophosphatase MutT (NUDIX family)